MKALGKWAAAFVLEAMDDTEADSERSDFDSSRSSSGVSSSDSEKTSSSHSLTLNCMLKKVFRCLSSYIDCWVIRPSLIWLMLSPALSAANRSNVVWFVQSMTPPVNISSSMAYETLAPRSSGSVNSLFSKLKSLVSMAPVVVSAWSETEYPACSPAWPFL